ncbi:hypothetical protein BJF78_23000 [Pseudonocardia sp. CNS-139]|nr:hypothetical protein BJF78_23000 [Pseudonocardia sp. CNS-139]
MTTPRQPAYEPDPEFVPTDQLVRQQGVRPIASPEALPHDDPFESEQEYEDFLADLYRSRRADVA